MIRHIKPKEWGELCELEHLCPNCENKTGPCMDLFTHPDCGLVACSTSE